MAEKVITSAYGSIAHLPGSKMGHGDKRINEGQGKLMTEKTRNKHDQIIVTEKVDGSCVAVVNLGGNLIPITRSGYHVKDSSYLQHQKFGEFFEKHRSRFEGLLKDGERLCGEWMYQAHGLKYRLPHEPFVVFDIMEGIQRVPYSEFKERANNFTQARLIHIGAAFPIESLEPALETSGHGAIGKAEGAVYRLEARGKCEFLAKWVRADHSPGQYLPGLKEATVTSEIYNECLVEY